MHPRSNDYFACGRKEERTYAFVLLIFFLVLSIGREVIGRGRSSAFVRWHWYIRTRIEEIPRGLRVYVCSSHVLSIIVCKEQRTPVALISCLLDWLAIWYALVFMNFFSMHSDLGRTETLFVRYFIHSFIQRLEMSYSLFTTIFVAMMFDSIQNGVAYRFSIPSDILDQVIC